MGHSPVGRAFVGVEVELSVVLYKCIITQQLFCSTFHFVIFFKKLSLHKNRRRRVNIQ